MPALTSRRLTRWVIDLLLIAAGVVSVIFEPFSIAVHSIIGLAFAAAVGPHLWHRRAWIAGTLARVRRHGLRRGGSLSPRLRRNLVQAAFLAVLVVVVTTSGLWDWLAAPTRIRIHAISSVILIVVAAWHAWTRRRALRPGRRGRAPGTSEDSDTGERALA